MMGYIEVFRHDDQTNSRLYRATHPFTLRRGQRIVGGYLEVIPHWTTYLHNDGVLYDACALCNEDGKGMELPVNRLATARWAQAIGMPLHDLIKRDVLVGNVVLIFGDLEFMEDWS
jgi:hypothetical protein